MNEYKQRVLDGRKDFLKLERKQEKELLKIYEEASKQVTYKLSKAKPGGLTNRYLNELYKSIDIYSLELKSNLSKSIKSGIEASSQVAANVQRAYTNEISPTQNIKSTFNKMFTQLPSNITKQLISGNYYSDGKTLDQRLWHITRRNAKDIDTVIKVNVAAGTNARSLARDLDSYINPKKKMKIHKRIPGINKDIAYQAQRLARTSLTHASTETYIQGSKMNPFNQGLKWNLSPSHFTRMHGKTDICDEYSGKIFKVDKYPISHPNCLCYATQANIPIEEARKELINWVNGKENSKLDKWYENNKNQFISINNNNEPKQVKWGSFSRKDIEFKNKKEMKKHLLDNYNIKFSDSTKYPIHKDIFQDSVNWLDKFHSYFKGFKEIDPVELPVIKTKARMNAVGYYQYYTNRPKAVELALNGAYFTDKEYNNNYIQQCIKSRWTVANAKSYTTFVHEYGHHVANSLNWLDKEKGIESRYWCKDFINETIEEYNKKYSKNISFKDIVELVSRYGGTKPEEAFAETFAEYFGGKNPRDFAKVFGEKVEKKIKKYIEMKR